MTLPAISYCNKLKSNNYRKINNKRKQRTEVKKERKPGTMKKEQLNSNNNFIDYSNLFLRQRYLKNIYFLLNISYKIKY